MPQFARLSFQSRFPAFIIEGMIELRGLDLSDEREWVRAKIGMRYFSGGSRSEFIG